MNKQTQAQQLMQEYNELKASITPQLEGKTNGSILMYCIETVQTCFNNTSEAEQATIIKAIEYQLKQLKNEKTA